MFVVGFPKILWFGDADEYRCMTLSLLGPNLMQLFNFCDYKFSYKTVLIIGMQLMQRLQVLHSF